MNTLFQWDVRNKNPVTYDELVKMIRVEIVIEEMIDHRNRVAQGLPCLKGKGKKTHYASGDPIVT